MGKTVGHRPKFGFGNQGSGDSDRAVVYPCGLRSNSRHRTYDWSVGTMNYFYACILSGNWISRLIPVRVTSTLGRADGKWWLVMGSMCISSIPDNARLYKTGRIFRGIGKLRFRSFSDASLFWWYFGGRESFGIDAGNRKESNEYYRKRCRESKRYVHKIFRKSGQRAPRKWK